MTGDGAIAHWYALRTRSRHQKRVRDQLEGRPAVEVFLPPLGAPGVVDLVGMKGQPEPVPDAEIEAVRRVVESPLRFSVTLIRQSVAVEIDAADVTPV